jgi:hypothetical protein
MYFAKGEPVEFSPTGYADKPAPPRFVFRTPSVADRFGLAGDMLRAGLREPTSGELNRIMREGAEKVFDGEERDEILAFIDRAIARQLVAAEFSRWLNLQTAVARLYPPFAEANAAWTESRLMAPIVALQRLLISLEGYGVSWRRGGVERFEFLRVIPVDDLDQAAAFAISLFQPSEAQAKNFDSPAPLSQDPPNSPANTDATAGGPSETITAT